MNIIKLPSMNIVKYDSVSSTNIAARNWLDQDVPLFTPLVFVARKQTQGKGQQGNWFSPEDCGIYMSVIRPMYKPKPGCSCCGDGNFTDVELIMEMIVNKVRWAMSDVLCLDLTTRPSSPNRPRPGNDIYLNNRKVAGILCEYHANTDKLIIGIGINTFRPAKVRKDLLQKAVWLNEYSAEHLISHDILVEKVAEGILSLS